MINSNSLVCFITKDGIEERGNIKDKDDMHIFNLIDYIKDNYDGEKPLCNFNYRHCPNDVAYAISLLKDTAVFLNLSNREYDNSPKYGVLVVSNNLSEDVLNIIRELQEDLAGSYVDFVHLPFHYQGCIPATGMVAGCCKLYELCNLGLIWKS